MKNQTTKNEQTKAYEEIINETKKRYLNLEYNANEEQIQNHVVIPFLADLKYNSNPEWFHYQSRSVKGKIIFDIDIYNISSPLKRLIVEVKKKGTKITQREIFQLSSYINSQYGVNFGIITNGEDFILIDNSISGELIQRVIFRFNIFKIKDYKILKFFTYNSLFETCVTKYFRDLTQYKVFFLENNKLSSWNAYYGTLFNYFIFMADKDIYYPLDKIRVDDFKTFLDSRITKKQVPTLVNNYNHINGLYEMYKERGILTENPFEYIVKDLKFKIDKEIIEPLTDDEIGMIIISLQNEDKTHYPERNILLFYLLLYTGMSRASIQNLKVRSINVKKGNIKINKDKYLPICGTLKKTCNIYFEWLVKKGIETEYLFPSNYGICKGKNLSSGNFNAILNKCLRRTEISMERQKVITLKFIRETVVRRMYTAGISIEEIVYITGLSLSSIGKYISNEEIYNNVTPENIMKNHPFRKFFNIM